jgi:nucleoside recognition membrane protein YjiH
MEVVSKRHEKEENVDNDFIDILKIIIYSSIGIFVFFIPIKLNGQSITLIYHIAYKLQSDLRPFLQICIIVYAIIGCLKPILENKKKKKIQSNIFLYIRMFSIVIIVNIFYGKNTIMFLDENILLLIDELVLNVATVLPLSAIFITFLLDYGFLDIVESYFHNIMKKNFKLSGKTIVNILIYICTDCFCGMFVTNKLYKTGKIRYNEACIIILNFSIMSMPMVSYISKELNVDKIDIIVVSIITLIITNMILSRTYPLNKKKKSYCMKTNYRETIHKSEKLKNGIKKYLKNKNNKNILKTIIDNLEEAISIIINLIPELVMILYLGNIILNSGIILELSKYIFYPLTEIFKIADKGEISLFGINLFYNGIIGIENVSNYTQYSTKFLIGILAVTSCTSLSSNMVYIKNTDISITKKEFLVSYTQRIITIVFIYSIMYYFYRGYMM